MISAQALWAVGSNASRLEQLLLLPVIGLQIAVFAIIGQNMGVQRYDRVKRTFWLGIRIALMIMGVGMVPVWLFHNSLGALFAAGNTEVLAMSNLYLLYSSSALMAYALVLISGGVLQGMKKPIMPLLINIVRLILGPLVAFTVATLAFDVPNIHVGGSVSSSCLGFVVCTARFMFGPKFGHWDLHRPDCLRH